MFPLILQTLFLIAAGAALFRLWRVAASYSRAFAWLVGGGVLLRVGAGVPLFWISYLELPFARSLQLGNGFWWFASDATGYFGRAVIASNLGPGGILTIDPRHPSVFYTKVLATFVWLLGSVASVGLLLNLFAYLGIAALVAAWARRYDVSPRIAMLPLIAVAYSPSWILWSVQPLKDAFFCFWIIGFALALDQWIRAWREPELRWGRIALTGILVAVLIYGTAGVRWYYAVVALVCASLPILSSVFAVTTTRQRLAAAAAAVVLLLVMDRQIPAGAGPYLPESVGRVMQFRFERSYTSVAETVELSRNALDSFRDANTRIKAGEALQEKPQPPAPAVATTTQPAPPARVAAKRTLPPRTPAAPARTATPAPAPAAPARTPAAPARTPAAPARTPAAPVAVAAAPRPTAAPVPAAAESGEEGGGPEISDVPVTASGRLIAGAAAMLLPHFVAEGLGLISVGEARGGWWFANVDTILFDIFVISSLVIFVRRVRVAWRDPFAWYALAVSACMAGAIAYTISNFGALMRHRSMVLSTMVMLPLIAYRAHQRARRAAEIETETETKAVAQRVPDGVPLPADG